MKSIANEHAAGPVAIETGELILSEIQGRSVLVIYSNKDTQSPTCNAQLDEMSRKLRI